MKSKFRRIIITILAYLYLIFGYSYIVYNFSFHVRITNKLEGWAVLVGETLLYIIVFVIINHILINRIIPKRLLIIIEVLLGITILTLIWSDFMYDEYLHFKYIQELQPLQID